MGRPTAASRNHVYPEKLSQQLQESAEKTETKNVEICGLDIPIYDATKDYQFMYHKLFQENESKLQQYDKLLELRDRDLRAYMALKKGMFNDYVHIKLGGHPFNTAGNESQAQQIRQNMYNNDQIQKLIPQLIGKRNSSDVAPDDGHYKSAKSGHPSQSAFKFSRPNTGFGNSYFNVYGQQENRQDSYVSSEQEMNDNNTPKIPVAEETLYSDEEDAAHPHELSQKDFNDTKSEQLLVQHQSRVFANKSFTRNKLTTPQNRHDLSSEAIEAQISEQTNAERRAAQEQALNQILQAQQQNSGSKSDKTYSSASKPRQGRLDTSMHMYEDGDHNDMGKNGPFPSRRHAGATESSALNQNQINGGETASNKRTTGKKTRGMQENRSMVDEKDNRQQLHSDDDMSDDEKKVDESQLEGSLTEGLHSDFIAESQNKFVNSLIQNLEIKTQLTSQISKRETQRKKHVRRCAKELKKEFPCLYNCGKEYATDAARNMHMRDKHNDVTKTERDRKAREIIRTFGLKNGQDIIQKLSQLTQAQQTQLQNQLMLQSGMMQQMLQEQTRQEDESTVDQGAHQHQSSSPNKENSNLKNNQ